MQRFIKLFFLATLVTFGAPAENFAASDVSSLRLNVPATREFKGGERHFFSVKAQGGERMEIIADKNAVDIGLTAFSPDDEKISASNAPGGFTGRETLFFVAEKSGAYQIEVASKRPGNFTGNYTITLTGQSAATESDWERAAAMKTLAKKIR